MIEGSLRQKVFKFMDNNPEAKPKDVYTEYPEEKTDNLRTYRTQYLKAKAKSISELKIAGEKDIPKVVLVSKKDPSKIDEIEIAHFFTMLNTFKSIPLFIYSRIYTIVRKKYGINPLNWLKPKPDLDMKDWTFSFYDMFMEMIDKVCKGYYDNAIMEYEANQLQLYGNTECQMRFDMDFIKEDLERINTGSYAEDYEVMKGNIEKSLEDNLEHVLIWLSEYDTNVYRQYPKNYKALRSKMLWYLWFELDEYSEFLCRSPDIIKNEFKKIIIEYNTCNNSDPLNFVEWIKYYNSNRSVNFQPNSMTVKIDKKEYIDLGTNGSEFLGVYPMSNGSSQYYDNVEFY